MEADTLDTMNYILKNENLKNIIGLSKKKMTPVEALEYLQEQSFECTWRITQGTDPSELIITSEPF